MASAERIGVTTMLFPHVSEYMTSGPFAIGPRDSLAHARYLMEKHGVRHLPVWAEGKLVGIVSDRDLDLVQALERAAADTLDVADAMTPEPYAPSPDTPVLEVVQTLVDRKIGSAVVVDRGQIVGIFTETDAMRALMDVLVRTRPERPAGSSPPRGITRRVRSSW